MLCAGGTMPELVMVIEDEKEIRDLIRYNLERAGFRVSAFPDGEEGLGQIFASRPDAVVLDLMLPGRSGLEVLREVRDEPATRDLPVLVLTARSAEMDKLLGFEHGADDYLTKPFSPRELVARIKALLRRAQPSRAGGTIVAGDLKVDTLAHEATWRGRPLTLTPREFDLLAFLAHRPGRVMSREELLRKVWGYDYVGETRTVDVHIRRLRVKLGEKNRVIETVTGAGYKLVAPRRAAA
jgi:DNA-binding response OmpR family regulator